MSDGFVTADGDDEDPGVPTWVVTYGDMMSLLLTFFIMLVSLSEVVADSKYRAVLDALHEYLGFTAAPASPPGTNFPLNSMIQRLKTLGSFANVETAHGGIKTQALEGTDMRVYRNREGQSLLVGEPLLFQSGSAQLSVTAGRRLADAARVLAGKPNKIEIRGHTGPARDTSALTPSLAVRLSYERARNVLRALEELGIEHERMRITAAGDTMPLETSGDLQSRRLDRVEIFVLDAFAEEYVGPRDQP